MKKFIRSRRGAILIVGFIALVLWMWASFQLPLDYDEPVYLQNAFDYARFIRAGDLKAIIDYNRTLEHPPLTRLLHSLTILPLGNRFGWSEVLTFARLVSVIVDTLAVWVLALVDPLAGGLFAIQAYAVKYTSQAYLEAVLLFASLAALFALRFSKAGRDRLFWLSAIALVWTATGKFSYFPIFIVILYVYFVDKKYSCGSGPARDWRAMMARSGALIPLKILAYWIRWCCRSPWRRTVLESGFILVWETGYICWMSLLTSWRGSIPNSLTIKTAELLI